MTKRIRVYEKPNGERVAIQQTEEQAEAYIAHYTQFLVIR
jgi:hypothetical protein